MVEDVPDVALDLREKVHIQKRVLVVAVLRPRLVVVVDRREHVAAVHLGIRRPARIQPNTRGRRGHLVDAYHRIERHVGVAQQKRERHDAVQPVRRALMQSAIATAANPH